MNTTEQTPEESARSQMIAARAETTNTIRELHEKAESLQTDAIHGIQDLIDARLAVASLAESARANLGSAAYHAWWRDAGLPAEWDRKYITLAKTSKRIALTDKNQMRLIGILPEPEEEEGDTNRQKQNPDNHLAWVKIAGKLKATLTAEAISTMDTYEKQTARNHLKPLVDLYNSLGD